MKKKCIFLVLTLASCLMACQSGGEFVGPNEKKGASKKLLKTRSESNPDNKYGFYRTYPFPTNLFYPSYDNFYGSDDVLLTSVTASNNGKYVALRKDGGPTGGSGGYLDAIYNNIFVYKVNAGNSNGMALMRPQTGLETTYSEDFINIDDVSRDIIFTPDNKHLIVMSEDRMDNLLVKTYMIENNTVVRAWHVMNSYPHNCVQPPVFSKDGKYMVFAGTGSSSQWFPGVHFYVARSLDQGEPTEAYPMYSKPWTLPSILTNYSAQSCDISPLGDYLAVINDGPNSVYLFKIDESLPNKITDCGYLNLPTLDYVDCAFSPTGKYLAISNSEGNVTIFKITKNGRLEEYLSVAVPDAGKIKWAPEIFSESAPVFAVLSGGQLRAYMVNGGAIEEIKFSSQPNNVTDFDFVNPANGHQILYVTHNASVGSWGLSQYEFRQ